jgi:phytanoyl-CoA hydroxylase
MDKLDETIATFRRDGIAVVPGFAGPEEIAAMREAAATLLSEWDPAAHRSVFSTDEQTRTSDDYFLSSGDNISFFLEEDCFGADGELRFPRERCVNKIGHALHEQIPAFRDFTFGSRVRAVCGALGVRRPILLQSMYICKQPEIGGAVRPHQDATFLYAEPEKDACVGLWVALEDATEENGCLHAVRGSHTWGVRRRFERDPSGRGTRFVPPEPDTWDLSDGVALPVRAGDLVMIHGAVVHWSEPNTSQRSRHAYTVHVLDAGEEGFNFPARNWIRRSDGNPFYGFDGARINERGELVEM